MEQAQEEQVLIERAQKGDRGSFDSLMAFVRERLAAFVESRLGVRLRNGVEPDDIIQDATFRAFLAIKRFEWRGKDSFFRWLCSIAEFVMRDLARSCRRPKLPLEHDMAGEDPTPSTLIRRNERLARLMRAYEGLSPEHRETLRLSMFEGRSVQQIATLMGRSESAVRHLVLRALQKVREQFGEETESYRLPPRLPNGKGESDGAS